MPLWLLLILVVSALSLVTLALHLLGLSRIAPWTGVEARAAWLRQFPDLPPKELLLAHNGRAALVLYDGGRGLVWQFGADSTARCLSDIHLTKTPRGVRLQFKEFAVPRVTLQLDDSEMLLWMKELQTDDG